VKILVTGAGGFIGHNLVKFLVSKGHTVVGADIVKPKWEPSLAYCFYLADLRCLSDCCWTMESGIDQVYQLAADMGGIGYITGSHASIARNNVLINTSMLEASKMSGVRSFLFSSSACVYPQYRQLDSDINGLKEEDAYPADPEEGYGWEKLFTEQLCRYYREDYGLNTRVVRLHNVYGPCYDERTEVLTRKGFKFFKDLVFKDEIATLNSQTGYLEYHQPSAIQKLPYEGLMYKISSRNVDLLITPDHSMWYAPRRTKSKSLHSFQFGKAEDVCGRSHHILTRSAKWKGEWNTVWLKPKQVTNTLGYSLQKRNWRWKVRLTHWLEFLGWYLAEGSTVKTGNYIVFLAQRDPANQKEIAETVQKMGYKARIIPTGVEVSSKQLYEMVEPFGHAHQKYIPYKYMLLPPRHLARLFRTLMLGDGDKDGGRYSTTSCRLADSVMEIALKLGYGVQVAKEPANNPGHHDMYRVHISKRGIHRILPHHINKLAYVGTVYDVTVPNHIVLVRRNGKIVWSGNCGAFEGGREKAPAALCRKIALANNGDEIEVWGDGNQTRSFLYIDDCLEGLYAAQNSDHHGPINIGSEELVTVNELVDIIAKIAGKTIRKRYDTSKPQGVRGRNSDSSLALKVLGWSPKVPLEVGLERTYRWIEDQVRRQK